MMKWDKLKIDIKKGTDSLKTGMKKVVKQAVTEGNVLRLKKSRKKRIAPDIMSILAGIDIGTNTVRLLIADVKGKYSFKEIRSERRITRLGEGLIENGRLMPSAEDRTIFVLKEFGEILKGYPVEALTDVATSAVRGAENGREVSV